MYIYISIHEPTIVPYVVYDSYKTTDGPFTLQFNTVCEVSVFRSSSYKCYHCCSLWEMALHLPEKKRKNSLRNDSHYISL